MSIKRLFDAVERRGDIGRRVAAFALPSRPVRVIVPAAAGGPSDIIGQLLAQKLSEAWGKQFIVENIPTGAGNVGCRISG